MVLMCPGLVLKNASKSDITVKTTFIVIMLRDYALCLRHKLMGVIHDCLIELFYNLSSWIYINNIDRETLFFQLSNLLSTID